MLKRKSLYTLVASFCLFLFLFLAEVIFTEQMTNIDKQIATFFLSFTNEKLTILMIGISWFSNPFCLLLLSFSALFFLKDKEQKTGIFLNLAGVITLNQIIKQIIKRLRPTKDTLIIATGYSFPSGHAMVSLAFYGYLFFLLYKNTKKNKNLYFIFYILFVFLIGISRIYLGVHYFSDVLAGFFLSTFYLIFFIQAYEYFKKKRNYKKFFSSFKYATQGIFSSLKQERNMKIHFVIMHIVVLFGILCKISIVEWMICILCFSLVIGLEMVNTAIEETVDLITKEKKEEAKLAKDIAAGAVLIVAIASACIGLLIFIPKFVSYLS